MTKRTINAAIKHLGLEIQHERGSGYCYFTRNDITVGDSVMVCHLNHLSLEEWVIEAKLAATRESHQ